MDSAKMTPLMLAAQYGHEETVGILVKNNANVEFIGQGGTGEAFTRALCSNMAEGAGASWGDTEYYPQFSWHLDHQEDKRKFKSGCAVRIRAVDNTNGQRGRFLCSNCDGSGASFSVPDDEDDVENGNTYGWELVRVDGGKHIKYGEDHPVFIMSLSNPGTCLRSDTEEGGNFSFCEPDEGDTGCQWALGKMKDHWQESSEDQPEGRRIESGECIQLSTHEGRALCSNMPESGGASYGDLDYYPQFSWRIVSGTGKKYIKAGDPVILAALDNGCGEQNRVFCSNNTEGQGCSWSNPPWSENIYDYGFTMGSFSGSRHIRFGDEVFLTGTHGAHLNSNTGEGEAFSYTEDADPETNGWIITSFDNMGNMDEWDYTSESSD